MIETTIENKTISEMAYLDQIDEDILERMFLNKKDIFYPSQLSKELGYCVATISAHLHKMNELGLVIKLGLSPAFFKIIENEGIRYLIEMRLKWKKSFINKVRSNEFIK